MICSEIEEELAMDAIGALDAAQSAVLKEHIRQCAACAKRWKEFHSLSAAHSGVAAELADLSIKRQSQESSVVSKRPAFTWLIVSLRSSLAVGAVGIFVMWLTWFRHPLSPPESLPKPSVSLVTSVAPASSEANPTIGAYREALERSGENSLEALLSRDATHLLPRGPDDAGALASDNF